MSKPKLTQAVILAFLRRRFGEVAALAPLKEGLVSQAFEFFCRGDPYVIRVGHSIDGYRKELVISRAFGGKGLPVPAIVDTGELDESCAYCISRRLPGSQLHECGAEVAATLTGSVIELLQRIGDVDVTGTSGFGPIDGCGRGACGNWREYVVGVAQAPVPPLPKGEGVALNSVVAALKAIVAKHAASCPEVRRLIHGDFGSYNVLSDGHGITGIVDWDMAKFGDPLFDAANVLFWDEVFLRPVAAALRELGRAEPGWRERTECYQACIGLFELGMSVRDQNESAMSWLLKRCGTLLTEWEEADPGHVALPQP